MTFELPSTLEYGKVSINLSNESPERIQNAITYLLNYGFGKSLQDSVAGVKKEEAEKNKEREAKGEPLVDIDALIAATMADRAEAIFAGTLGVRGPRLSGPDAIRRDVIADFFKAWAAKQGEKGQTLPSLKSEHGVSAKDATKEQKEDVAKKIAAIRDRYAAANAAKIEAEVARRLELQSEEVDVDIDF